ncbi:interferon-induced protein 44-like [Engraulis encrasicolus]|uniref:interferon-induced protein 44-like n=1 Tax=Engraulis encrasicolus TaxID=184585 RepID=UPI002FD33CB1
MGNSQSTPQPHPEPVSEHLFPDDWRTLIFDVSKKAQLFEEVRNLRIRHPKVEQLRLLVVGPVGAGKSTLINSIVSIFQGRMCQGALADTVTNTSFTQKFQIQKIRDGDSGKFLPFVICDIMGLEGSASVAGVCVDDITMVLKGHVKDGYQFNPSASLKEDNQHYRHRPTLNDKIHCLVAVLPADKIAMMDNDSDSVISKMHKMRKEAAALKIPQVVVMTMVDQACTEVKKDRKMIYRSKKIKEKMQECSNKLGVPMSCVYPVKNYHEEIELDDDIDILLLSALTSILGFSNDYVGEDANDEGCNPPEVSPENWRVIDVS